MIHLIATLTIIPGTLDAVLEAAQPCIAATRLEDGCISYDLHQSLTDADTLVFVERWESRSALDAHFQTDHLKAWREAGGKYFTSRRIEIISDSKVDIL